MSNIVFPSDVEIIDSRLWTVYPGQEAHRSPYTGGHEVVTRSYGNWMGVLIFGFLDYSAEDQVKRRDIEAFAAELEGMENTTDAPVDRPNGGGLGDGVAISFGGLSNALPLGSEILFSSPSEIEAGRKLVRGDYVRIADRLHIVMAESVVFISSPSGSAGLLKVRPRLEVVPAVGSAILWNDVTVRCRASSMETWRDTEATPEFYGPWQMEWIEVV